MRKVMFISAHPDDETLGCGGTILKHGADETAWLNITDAVGYPKEFIQKRDDQICRIIKTYAFDRTYFLGYPTTELHMIGIGEIISRISEAIIDFEPDTIYTVNRSDVHTDHQVTAQAVTSATKAFRYPFIKRILMYECISETEMAPPLIENLFLPNAYSDITEHIDEKIMAMQIYESEVQEPPMPRSLENIRALARYRGASIGREYAEAFMLLRDVF